MRIVALSLSVLWILTLASCQSKAAGVKQLQDQYNAEYPAYAKDCVDPETAGAGVLLTGKQLTQEEIATLEAKKYERETRCKPQRTVLPSPRRRFSLHSSKAVLLSGIPKPTATKGRDI